MGSGIRVKTKAAVSRNLWNPNRSIHTSDSQERELKKRLRAAMLACIILAVAVASLAVYHYSPSNSVEHPLPPSPAPVNPASVALNGTVTTTGFETTPENITFENLNTGQNYTADTTWLISTSDGAAIGTYAITLPNQDSYKVIIDYRVARNVPSQYPVGPCYSTLNSTVADQDFSFNTHYNSLTQNFSC